MKRLLATTAGTLALTLTSWSQDFIELRDGTLFPAEANGAGMPGTTVGPDGVVLEEAANQRQTMLAQLLFDRRPSIILAVWSTPPAPPAAEEPAQEETVVEVDAPGQDPGATEEGEGESVQEKSEEQLVAEAEARRMAEEAAAAQAAAEAEAKAIAAEMARFQRLVTLGHWDEVKAYLAGLTEEEAKTGYRQMLTSLVQGPKQPRNQFAAYNEKNYFAPEDVLGLAAAAPGELEAAELTNLGRILSQCVEAGSLVENCVRLLQAALEANELPFGAIRVARIVLEAGHPLEAGVFLPTPDQAEAADDRTALNLLARHYLARHDDEGDPTYLEQAWSVTQAVLADGEVSDADKLEALSRAVDVAPRIRAELGQVWLDESFTGRPDRGMEILATIGAAVSTGLVAQAADPDARYKGLELQTTAANALLAAAPEQAAEWSGTLNLLAANWLREAEFSYANDQSTSLGPNMRRDQFGNIYYYNYPRSFNRNMPQPITTDKMLDIRPSDAWLDVVVDGLRPRFDMVSAQLLLKVNEEDEAFPYIERLAQDHPPQATELVEEFLRVWARNHNPNSASDRTNSYMFMYGFEERANAIPLTRSKQERNLAELAELVARLRALPLDDIDEDLIASAFTSAHSTAEVYRIETIEQVFGDMDQLGPKTLAELIQRMRSNLVGVWKQPAVQKDKKTRRRQQDIQNEILRGYEVARAVADRGLVSHPDDWPLLLARASVDHDENNFRQEVARFAEFTSVREAALADFQRAAEFYRDQFGKIKEDEETSDVYDTWFYATLGACDLNAIDSEKQLVTSQLALIRQAILSLPGDAADRHMGMFANSLSTRLSSVNPAVKFRYVRSGLEIAGNHERADEIREILAYYDDLVTEIQLETRIDGGDRVGHEEPFGIYIDIRHTREIEREAGGFAKYLVNQNDQRFSYNYGRPTEDYRDKFEEAALEALSEQFDVHSITFNHPNTHSRADEEYGWRVTPYAYALVQARGPEVDRVPPLHLDLDFLDTSGYAVLPVESAPIVIDASGEDVEGRPFQQLEITQTLDERQAKDGRLVLEVNARALGLVPALGDVLKLSPAGFEVVAADDQGVSVTEFDQESTDIAVASERTWMVTMQAREELEELPETFTFGTARTDDSVVEYQRYVDADLVAVQPVVSLEARYGARDVSFLYAWLTGALGVLAVVGGGWWLSRRLRRRTRPAGRFVMPESVSAFTVIGLLRNIEAHNGVSGAEREELQRHLEDLEASFFRGDAQKEIDLHRIASTWVDRVS